MVFWYVVACFKPLPSAWAVELIFGGVWWDRFAGFIALAAEKMICLVGRPCAIPTAKAVIVFGAFEWFVKSLSEPLTLDVLN